jgi:arylformamidase
MPRIVDLSVTIQAGHFRWPTQQTLDKSFEEGAFVQATRINVSCHAFTHMDAPRHFDPKGYSTDSLRLEQTIGPAAVVDVSSVGPNAPIQEKHVAEAGGHIQKGDIVLLRAGWDKHESIEKPEFWTRAPWVEEDAAEWLFSRGIKAIGYDFPQDYCIRNLVLGDRKPAPEENITHEILLKRGVIMMEYLCNMTSIKGMRCDVFGLPIKVPNADGAPARIIAIEED